MGETWIGGAHSSSARRLNDVRHVEADVAADFAALLDATDTETPPAARRLLVAAVEAFGKRGYHATTTRDIASGADMSPAALYVHYPSKEHLLFALIRFGHEQALHAVCGAVTAARGPVERLTAYVSAFTFWHAEQHTLARVTQDELAALSEEHFFEIAALRREIEGTLRAVVEDGVAAGQFVVEDVAGVTLAILSLSIDVARWFPLEPSRTSDQVSSFYAGLALRMLHDHSPPAS